VGLTSLAVSRGSRNKKVKLNPKIVVMCSEERFSIVGYGRRPAFFSPVLVVAFFIWLFLFVLSYYVFLPSEFSQPPSLIMLVYVIALFVISVPLAMLLIKAFQNLRNRFQQTKQP
jgi:uncharacterized membrane-anchored protein